MDDRYVLIAFEKDPGDALVGEWPMEGISLAELQEMFGLPMDEPLYDSYPVRLGDVPRIQETVSHQIDLEARDYFVEARAGRS
jgi:hypothetical protein